MAFQLGTDPEFIIKDKDGKPVPAWKFFPDKKNKVNVDIGEPNSYSRRLEKKDLTAFHDGYAVEINLPPMECRGNLAGWMLMALKGVQKQLPEGYTLCSLPSVDIDLEDMRDAPPDCQIFGCDPSWNAYEKEEEGVVLSALTHKKRYAGGHMHISIPNWIKDAKYYERFQWIFNREDIFLFVKMLDRHIGLPLTAWFAKPETFDRRAYYGKAGEFRFQDYGGKFAGVEYRVPGPEVWNSPVVSSFAFGIMRHIGENFDVLKQQWDTSLEEKIRWAINTGNGIEELLPLAYMTISGSENTQEWFNRTLQEKPFQALAQEFEATTTVGHMGWDTYQRARDEGKPYRMTLFPRTPQPVQPVQPFVQIVFEQVV